jgi:hypothetical protein
VEKKPAVIASSPQEIAEVKKAIDQQIGGEMQWESEENFGVDAIPLSPGEDYDERMFPPDARVYGARFGRLDSESDWGITYAFTGPDGIELSEAEISVLGLSPDKNETQYPEWVLRLPGVAPGQQRLPAPKADGPTTTAGPTADEMDAMMDNLADQVEDKPKKAATAKPRKYQQPKKSEKTKATAEEKRAQAKQALRDALKETKDKPTSGLNPEVGLKVLKAVKLYIEADILDFKSFIESVVEDFDEAWVRDKAGYLESAWRVANKRGWVSSPVGKVTDVLPAAKAVEPREIGPLKKDEVRPRVEGQTWDEVGTGETSESIKEKVPGLEVDPLTIKGTHDLVEKIVFDVKEINSRRLAARKRRQRIERERSPLFSDEIASQQEDPLEELKAIDAKNNQNREFYDDATRNHWMDQLKRLAELPADEQRKFVTFWNTSSYPRSWANFAGSLSKWKSGKINTAKVVDRSGIADSIIRARVEKLDKTWVTLKDIEQAAGDPKVAQERLKEEEDKYSELGFSPPAYKSKEKTFAERQAEKEVVKKSQEDEAKKQILPGLVADDSKVGSQAKQPEAKQIRDFDFEDMQPESPQNEMHYPDGSAYRKWMNRKHRIGDTPTSYLTGHSSDKVRESAKENPGLGLVVTPGTKQYVKHGGDYSHIMIDNGAFSEFTGNAPFSEEKFFALLDAVVAAGLQDKVQHVVVPDKVGDWQGTNERWKEFNDRVRAYGMPVAYVAQDGIEEHVETIPWDDFDVLFIGGSTPWKLGYDPKGEYKDFNRPTDAELRKAGYLKKQGALIKEAQRRGKRVHMGRVNSWKRMELANYGAQVDSADGNFIGAAPDNNLPIVVDWLKGTGGTEFKADRVQQIQDSFPVSKEVAITADILMDTMALPGEVEIAPKGTKIPGDILAQKTADIQTTGRAFGYEFVTGQPVTFTYRRNTESATGIHGKPKKGDRFGRHLEPSGEYMIVSSNAEDPGIKNWIAGEKTFQSPLVIETPSGEPVGWKEKLSKAYGGKTGKKLSLAIIADGFDGIVTVADQGGVGEIVDLTTFDEGKALFQKQRNQEGVIQAWTHFVNASKAIIGATDKADVSSFFHEILHPAHEFLFNKGIPQEERGNITDEDIDQIEKWLGVKPGAKWTRDQKEKFVDGGMTFLLEGKAPTPELKTVFQKIAEWLSDVVSVLSRRVDISEVRPIFEKLFSRGQVSPAKLQALKEALAAAPQVKLEVTAEVDSESMDDALDDFFDDAPSDTRVKELEKIAEAGIKVKQTANGWTVTGLPKDLPWDIHDGLRREGGRRAGYGYLFKDNPTSRLAGAAEEIIKERQLVDEAAKKGLVRTRIGDLNPEDAEGYENERTERIRILQEARSEAIQRVTDALIVSPKNRGMFAIKLKKAAESDYDSIGGFDQMAGLAGISEQELFEFLQRHKPLSDREIEEQVDNELASQIHNKPEEELSDLAVEDGDTSFDFGAPEKSPQSQQSAIEGLEDDVARLERKDIRKAKSDKFRAELEADSSKGKQKTFLTDIYGDPTQGTLFDPDGVADEGDTLFQATKKPEWLAAEILSSAVKENGVTTFEGYIAHAKEQKLRDDQILQNASVFEAAWDGLRKRGGRYAELAERTSSVSDILAAKPEPVKPEKAENKKKPKSEKKPKQPEPKSAPEEETTGTKHAKTDELRAKHGFPERVSPVPETFEEWEEEARRKYPDAEARLRVVELAESQPNRISKIENAAIGQHIVDLENRRKAGEDVLEELLRTVKASTVAGTEAGRDLVSRKAERFSDFSLAGLVEGHIDRVGKDPTEEQMAKYQEMADKISALEGELDAIKKKVAQDGVDRAIAEAKAKADAAKNPPPPKIGTKKEVLQKKASAAVAAFKDEWNALYGNDDTSTLYQSVRDDSWDRITKAAGNVIKSYAELGVDSFLELMASVKRDIGNLTEDQVEAFKEAWASHKKGTKAESPLGDKPDSAGIGRLARDLTRWAVESGIEKREEVIDAVHQELQDMEIELTRSEVMAAMSGYGDFRELPKDDVSVKVRGIKGEIQQLLKLEDMQSGKAPLKTGVEKREQTEDERKLIKDVNEAKKRGGYEVTDPDRQLTTPLGTAKKAVSNRIKDLDAEIDELDAILKSKHPTPRKTAEPTPQPTDTELEALRARAAEKRKQRDELKKEYEKIFPSKKNGMTDANRLKAAEALLDRQIRELQADLDAGRLDAKGKREPLTSDALTAKKAVKASLVEAREQARLASPEYQAKLEAKQNAQYKKSLQKQLAFWESRRDDAAQGKLPEKRKSKAPVDDEILEKKWQIEQVKRQATAEIENAERAARGPVGKALGVGGDVLDLARAIQTGYEMSAVLRQGAMYTLGFPKQAIPALAKAFQAMVSRRADFAHHDDLLKRKRHLQYKSGKMETTAADGPLSHREEAIRSRLASWLSQQEGWLWAAPRWAAEGVLASERAFRTFSNIMRADLFDIMADVVDANRPGTWTDDDAKVIGHAANVFSGRAPLQHAVAWGRVLYAPRWVWSRALLTVGQPAWKGDRATRRAVGKVYVRAALGFLALQGMKHIVYGLLADDDEDKPKYEFDPRSSNFGKTRIGDTRIDTGAGVNQLVTFMARLATGQTKRQSGEIVNLRGDDVTYGAEDATDVMTRFLRTKLAPLPSGVIDWIAGENVVGEKSTTGKIITDRLTPMTWADIWDAEEELNVPQGTVAAIEAFFGSSVSTYGDKTKYRESSTEERAEILKKDLNNLDWDSPVPAYAEFLTDNQLTKFDKIKEYRYGQKVYNATGSPDSESGKKMKAEAMEAIKDSGVTFDEARKALIAHWRSPLQDTKFRDEYVSGLKMRLEDYRGKRRSAGGDDFSKRIANLRKLYKPE